VPAVIEAEPSLMALEGVDFRFWHITSIPGLIETAAIEGNRTTESVGSGSI
jgi:hypothetical protein